MNTIRIKTVIKALAIVLLIQVFGSESAIASEIKVVNDSIKETTAQKEDKSQNIYTENGESFEITFIWSNKNKKKNSRKLSAHWSGFGMSFMNYNDKNIPHGTLKMSTSHNFTLNLMSYGKQINHSNWLVVFGLGFDWSRYHFDTNAALTKVDGVTQFVPAPEGVNYRSTKLLSYYVTLPLMMEYQVKDFHISAGGVLFFKYYSKSQVKYYDEEGKHKVNMGRDLNIHPVDLRLKGQIGFKNISIYGYYAPISMFRNGKGPKLRTSAIGFMFNF